MGIRESIGYQPIIMREIMAMLKFIVRIDLLTPLIT